MFLSRVTPGEPSTIAALPPTILLKRVDLPTFTLPMMDTTGTDKDTPLKFGADYTGTVTRGQHEPLDGILATRPAQRPFPPLVLDLRNTSKHALHSPAGRLFLQGGFQVMQNPVFGMRAESGRWLFLVIGLLINICLGAVYAFSVFKVPLQDEWGIGATQSGLPFMVFLASFAAFMALAGGLVERWGPRRSALLGGTLVGAGWILAGFSPGIGWFTLSYGLLGGAGVGVVYGVPITVAAQWFPDRKGLAVGLTVMGFGLSALVMAPVMRAMIANPSIGPFRTFTYLGVAFTAILALLSLPLHTPPDGWKPSWLKARQPEDLPAPRGLDRSRMLRTPTFYALWGTYTIGCLAGLMAIGISSPVGQEVAGLSPAAAAVSVSLFAVFNGIGRPLFGWLTDRLAPRNAASLSFVLILLSSALLYLFGQGNKAVYFTAFGILWLNLGGWLAIAPTATATLFGTAHYAKNYGIVFTSYGVGALLGNTLAGMIRDASGGYLPVFLPVMGLAALGIIVAALWLKPLRRE